MLSSSFGIYVQQIISAILRFIEQGGIVMWPLFGCCLWMLWLVSQSLLSVTITSTSDKNYLINRSSQYPWLFKRLSMLNIRNGQQRQYANLQGVKLLAMVAPLLGLLGTVNGMINMFETGADFGFNDPAMISTGISMAMITTQTGLIVGLTGALFAYIWQRKLKKMDLTLLDSALEGEQNA